MTGPGRIEATVLVSPKAVPAHVDAGSSYGSWDTGAFDTARSGAR
jgi:hypothetical protein